MKASTLNKVKELQKKRLMEVAEVIRLIEAGKTHDELNKLIQETVEQYNSPEEIAKRKERYEEVQRIAELRRMDFLCGRDMDKCHPLPWQ